MVVVNQRETKNFIGKVTDVELRRSRAEGIECQEYLLSLESNDADFFTEWIPVMKDEKGENVQKGTQLDFFLKEVFATFPDLKNIVEHKEVMKSLIGKECKWIRKPYGTQLMDLPPRYYFVPRPKPKGATLMGESKKP